MHRILLITSFSLVCGHASAQNDPIAPLKKGQPRDVARMIDRIADCTHWAGEEPYDAERKREISAALSDLKCARLDRDVLAMKKRYADRPNILKALNYASAWSY